MAHWLFPANTKYYDVFGAFEQPATYWPMKAKLKVGDIVYFYLAAPYKQIAFVCEVKRTHLLIDDVYEHVCRFAKEKINRSASSKPFAELFLVGSVPIERQSFVGLAYLKENGLNGMLMGPRKLENNPKLLHYITEQAS